MSRPIYATGPQLGQLIAIATRRAHRRRRAGETASLQDLITAELADSRVPAIGQALYRMHRKETAFNHANRLRAVGK